MDIGRFWRMELGTIKESREDNGSKVSKDIERNLEWDLKDFRYLARFTV